MCNHPHVPLPEKHRPGARIGNQQTYQTALEPEGRITHPETDLGKKDGDIINLIEVNSNGNGMSNER